MLPRVRFAFDEICTHLTDRDWWRGRVHERINGPVQRWIHGNGDDDSDADWDTLLVLDACRADLFEEVVDTEAWNHYAHRNSGAGATNRWLERQWSGEYVDTAYVTGNPMVSRHLLGSLHDLIEAWRHAIDDSLNAPSAVPVMDAAIDAHERLPPKELSSITSSLIIRSFETPTSILRRSRVPMSGR